MEKNFVDYFNNKMEGLFKDKEQLENEMNNTLDKDTYIYKSFENDYNAVSEELYKIQQQKDEVEKVFKDKEETSALIEDCNNKIKSLEQRKQECLDAIENENTGIEKNYIVEQYEKDLENIEEELNKQEELLKENTPKLEELENDIIKFRKQFNIREPQEENLEEEKQEVIDEEVEEKQEAIEEEVEEKQEAIEEDVEEKQETINENSEEQLDKEQEEANNQVEDEQTETEEFIPLNEFLNGQDKKEQQEDNKDISLDEFLNGKNKKEQQEEIKNIPLNEFLSGQKSNGVVDAPEINTIIESLPSKVLISINEGKLQYQYENSDENIRMYDILEYNKRIKDMLQKEVKMYDPFLKEFLIENKDDDLLNTIRGQIGYIGGTLEAMNNRFSYNMAETEDLGFKARRQLRKMVKMLKGLGVTVENEESVKFNFKNDILKGLGNLFKGTMKGISGKTETQALLHASRQQNLSDEQMEELLKKDRNNNWVKAKYPTESPTKKVQDTETEKSEKELEIERIQREIQRAKQKVDEAKKQKNEENKNDHNGIEPGE